MQEDEEYQSSLCLRWRIPMPESKESALARAKREGFPASSVRKGRLGWYIIPHGITKPKAIRAYLHARDSGAEPKIAAAVAWSLQRIGEEKRSK